MKQKLPVVKAPDSRRGFALLVVTVVVVLLTLAAASFMNSMVTEKQAAMMFGRDVEARMAAESAVEFAACQIALKATDKEVDLYHNPNTFYNHAMNESELPKGQIRFSVVVPNETGIEGSIPRSGLTCENSKFNINRLMEFDKDTDETTVPFTAISFIPNMTEDITNAILDWIDSDETARVGGAESITYEARAIPYSARNAPMESIDELLQIQGVTPALFYGEDANRNGTLDPNEDDGSERLPEDDADGELDLGFRDFLTVSSRERLTLVTGDAKGEKKVNINSGILANSVYDPVEEAFDADLAKFITAYRLTGNTKATSEEQGKLTIEQAEVAKWIQDNLSGKSEQSVTRNGLDLTKLPEASFRSLYDLIDAEVESSVGVLVSPFQSSDPARLMEQMLELEDKLTYLDDEYIDGRININMAPREVLLAMPNMTEAIADAIIDKRPKAVAGSVSTSTPAGRNSAVWLLAEGVVDLPTLKRLGPWLTVGGDVYSFQALGYFDQDGPTTRIEAIIDATKSPPRIIFQRDLTMLGRGFEPSLLDGSIK